MKQFDIDNNIDRNFSQCRIIGDAVILKEPYKKYKNNRTDVVRQKE